MNRSESEPKLPDQLLTLDDVERILNVSKPIVTGLIRRGELPAHKIGRSWRIHPADLAELLDATRHCSDTGWDLNAPEHAA